MQKLLINGTTYEVDVPDEMPLLWVLRDILHLTGTKYGCGIAQCGACTVHLEGQAVRSCITPVAQVIDKPITTIEGTNNDLELLRNAWEEVSVPQCGFCQPGQLLSACDLLASNSNPTDEDIDDVMSGNICRCGTYERIRQAIHKAVELKNNAL